MSWNATQARQRANRINPHNREDAWFKLEVEIEGEAGNGHYSLNLGWFLYTRLEHWPRLEKYAFVRLANKRLRRLGYRVTPSLVWFLTGFHHVRW